MKITECDQYSDAWWTARRGVPTASEFSRIITPKKCEFAAGAETYAHELIAQFYDYNYGESNGFATAAMKSGTVMEPEARRYYEFDRDCSVTRVGFVTTDDGRFGASPDGLVCDDGGLELKHPTAAVQIKWLLAGVVPPEHLAQCHGALLVTSRKWWDWMSYYPGLPPLLVRVVPNEFTLKLAEALEQFWKLYSDMKSRITGAGDPVAATREPQESYW